MGGFFLKFQWEKKKGGPNVLSSSIGELLEAGQFFLTELQKQPFHSYLGHVQNINSLTVAM